MNPLSFQQPAWGATIALYFAMAGAIGGLPVMAEALVADRRGRAAERFRHAVFASSAALVVLASALLILDLGRPERFFLVLSELSLTSPISLGAKLVALDGYVALVLWFLYGRLQRARAQGVTSELGPRTRLILGGGELLALALSGLIVVYPAFVVAAAYQFPLGSIPGGWILFISSALLMGTGAVMMLANLRAMPQSLAPGRLSLAHRGSVLVHLLALFTAIAVVVSGDLGRATATAHAASTLLVTLVALAALLPVMTLIGTRPGNPCVWRGLALVLGGAATRCAFFAT